MFPALDEDSKNNSKYLIKDSLKLLLVIKKYDYFIDSILEHQTYKNRVSLIFIDIIIEWKSN